MKPRIWIAGDGDGSPNYIEAVLAAGGEPREGYLTPTGDDYDGIIFTGGGDVDPSFFGEEDLGSEDIDIARDKWELELFRRFFAAGKPILGICRGHQLINIALGGTLVQHIGDELCRYHRRTPDHEGDKIHAVVSAEGSWYRETFGSIFLVNSAHHQALGALGNGLRAVLRSESGIIEATEHETHPIISVQFHPERLTGRHRRQDTPDGGVIFDKFIRLCRETRCINITKS